MNSPPVSVEEEEPVPTERNSIARLAPWLLVALAIGFGLVTLRAELTPARYLNDEALHSSMVRWATHRIDSGHVPLDGWYPNFNLGLPQFHHYQSLPHIITGYVGTLVDPGKAFRWAEYLLLALWPLSIYWGARLFGFDRWTAGTAALVAPFLASVTSYGFEHSSYLWIGGGLWSQKWGMWLLPIAMGLSWRVVKGQGNISLGALAVGLTVALHFLTGYLALLSVVVWAVLSGRDFARRLVRAALVGIGAALTAAWVIVPLLADSKWSNRSQFNQNTFWYDSYGAGKVLRWLVDGSIYDHGRFPIITGLVAIGVMICLARSRRDVRARAVLAVWAISLLLFFGRPTLGPLLRLLPGTGDMQLHRYIMGVHLAGNFLAGIGAVWLISQTWQALRSARSIANAKVAPALTCVVLIALVVPAAHAVRNYDRANELLINAQHTSDQTDGADLDVLVREAQRRGPGRMYAGLPTNWGQQYKIGSAPVYAELTAHDVDVFGFNLRTVSLSADIEPYFDDTNLAQYDLFNVRYLFLPAVRPPPVAATFVESRGRHTLWEVRTSGYFDVVDTSGSIAADRSSMATAMLPFIRSPALARRLFPTVAFDGAAPAPSSIPFASNVSGRAGRVDQEFVLIADGSFSARVTANRSAVVLLKTTFDPRWDVTVDGAKATPIMIAPSFVGVAVPPGTHAIGFAYRPYPNYLLLLLLGVLGLIALVVVQSRWSWISRNAPPIDEATVEGPRASARVERSRSEVLRLLALATGFLSAAFVAFTVVTGNRIGWNGGCGDDGLQYCQMASGEVVFRPWSRRILLPFLVRVLSFGHDHVPGIFLALNLIALAAIAAGAFVLTSRLGRHLGADEGRLRLMAWLSSFLIILMPFGFHWISFYPTLVDPFAAALMLWWFLAATARDRWARWASIALALLAVIAREGNLVVIAAVLVAQVVVDRSSDRRKIAVATLGAIVLGGVIAFRGPGLPNATGDPLIRFMVNSLKEFGGVDGLKELFWMILFTWGVLSVLALRSVGSWFRRIRRSGTSLAALAVPAAVCLLVHLPLAVVGGYEVDRYLFPAAPFLLAFLLADAAVARRRDAELALAVLASVIIWRLFVVFDGTIANYIHFWFPAFDSAATFARRLNFDVVVLIGFLFGWLALTAGRRLGPETTTVQHARETSAVRA